MPFFLAEVKRFELLRRRSRPTGFRIRTLQPLGYTSTEHRPVPVCRPDERSRRPTEGPLFQIHAKRSGRKIRLLKIPKKQREIKRGGERNKNCSFSASVGLTRCGKIRYAKTTEQTRNEEVSAAEVVDYLTELYCGRGLSYRYVESFLKQFYLLFGQAYSRNYLDVDSYNKLCINKDTKIHMPKLKTDDDLDIVAFSKEELAVLDDYFHGTNAETAYLLGRYCGLRINECYGLKWSNVDVVNGTILIDRQMQYQNSLIKLVPLKTRNAKRTIYMCNKLKVYFQELAERRKQDMLQYAALREQNQRIIEDLGGKKISSTELVNCLPDGKIQTVNSMKYPSRELKSKYHIMFKYHYLRHTYGTMMAEMNTPTHLLCNQMGHGNIQVTQRYYIALSRIGIDILRDNLNRL